MAVRVGTPPERPAFYAQAYVPVLVDGRPVAIVAAYVDQTEKHDIFYRTFLIAAVSLCLGAALSFGLPAIAWYRRTKEKQQADRRIRFLAHHDALTELSNRPYLIEKLEKTLAGLPVRAAASPFTLSTSTASRRSTTRLVTTAATFCSRPSPSGCAQ